MKDDAGQMSMGKVWKNAVIQAVKIIVLAFSLICLLFATVVYAFPEAGAKLTSKLGMTNAERYCYVKIYSKSNKATDLYNLLLFEESVGNTSSEFEYINMLMAKKDYAEFCTKLDEASLLNCSDKKMIPYIYSVDMFLINQKIKCMYALDLDTVTGVIKQCLSSENLVDNSAATYVSLVVEGDLSTAQKIAKLNLLANTSNMVLGMEQRIKKLEEKFQELSQVSATQGISKAFAEKVVYGYLLMCQYKACYSLYALAEFDGRTQEKADEYKALWQSAAQTYDELVK